MDSISVMLQDDNDMIRELRIELESLKDEVNQLKTIMEVKNKLLISFIFICASIITYTFNVFN